MKNIRSKGKINIKLFLIIFWLFFLGLITLFGLLANKEKNQNLDYKLGIITGNGIALVSISNERRMINELTFSGEALNEIKNILERDKNPDSVKNMLWYNFGFSPDKILFLDSVDQWKSGSVLIRNMGFFNWLKYKFNYGKMLFKQENVSSKLEDSELIFDEILARDFSESRLNNEELRLSIFNSTNEAGLAAFMTKRLEWAGFSVVSADNNEEKINKCLIVYGNKVDLSYGWKIINKVFDCDKRRDENLNENELELYFGDSLASVIKYSSYFK